MLVQLRKTAKHSRVMLSFSALTSTLTMWDMKFFSNAIRCNHVWRGPSCTQDIYLYIIIIVITVTSTSGITESISLPRQEIMAILIISIQKQINNTTIKWASATSHL